MIFFKRLTNVALTICFFLFFFQAKASAEETAERQLTTILTVLVSSFALPPLIPKPKPILLIHESDFMKHGKRQTDSNSDLSRVLNAFPHPLMIKEHYLIQKKYGVVKSFSRYQLLLQTHSDSIRILLGNIKEIIDLESAAKIYKINRIKRGLTLGGLALTSVLFYNFITNPAANILKNVSQISVVLFEFGSFYAFVAKSTPELEYSKWKTEQNSEISSSRSIPNENKNSMGLKPSFYIKTLRNTRFLCARLSVVF